MKGYRIIPNKKLTNENIREFAKGIHNHIPFNRRWNRGKESNLVLLQRQKVYEIVITKNNIEFYFFSQDNGDGDLIKKYFNGVKLGEVDNKCDISLNYLVKEMELEHHFFMSLNTDLKAIEPLGGLLDIQKKIQADERAVIDIILVSCENSWYEGCTKAYEKFLGGEMPYRAGNIGKNLSRVGASLGIEFCHILQELLLGEKNVNRIDMKDDTVNKILREKPLSLATRDKYRSCAFDTTVRLMIKADSSRRNILMKQLISPFTYCDGDNKFKVVDVDLNKETILRIKNREGTFRLNKVRLGANEVAKLLQLPQVTLQNRFKMVNIENTSVEVPKVLGEGIVPIGKLYNSSMYTYWINKADLLMLPKVVVGKMGDGKSEYTINYAYHSYKKGNCVIVFDYIDECLIAKRLKDLVPKEDIIEIDVGENSSFIYSELSTYKDNEELKNNASQFSENIVTLINAVNTGSANPLTSYMRKVLSSACQVAFIGGYRRIIDVINILENYKFRYTVIKKVIEEKLLNEYDYKILVLKEIDETKTVEKKVDGKKREEEISIGTNFNSIDRIMDRIDILRNNYRLEKMLNNENDEINFIDEMQKNKVILIKMRESEISTKWIKDVIVSYYLGRVWVASLKRAGKFDKNSRNPVNIITDEIHQLENATKVILDHITEGRKFRIGFYFTCQYLKQFKALLEGVQGAGVDYMLLAGTQKENFTALKEECGDFELEELLHLPQFHSFNIVNTGASGIQRFITKLPRMA